MSQSPSSHAEIKSLTGLRGLAAIYVVLFHASTQMRFDPSLLPFIRHGFIMVDLFFILSGFVMALTYGAFFNKILDLKTYARFLLNRATRIWPLYALLTVITTLFIVFWFGKSYYYEPVTRAIIPNALMIQTWGLANSLDRPSWSVATEWTAYLLFPLFYWATLKAKPMTAAFWGAVAFGVLLFIAYGPTWVAERPFATRNGPLDIVSSYALGTTLRCLGDFVIGMVVYRFRSLINERMSLILFGLMLILLCIKGSDLVLILVFCALIMSLKSDLGPVAQLLSFKPFYWLGLTSYAIYLVHDPVLHLMFRAIPKAGFEFWGGKPVTLLLAFGVTLAVSALCYYGFEKPSRHRLKVWVSKLSF